MWDCNTHIYICCNLGPYTKHISTNPLACCNFDMLKQTHTTPTYTLTPVATLSHTCSEKCQTSSHTCKPTVSLFLQACQHLVCTVRMHTHTHTHVDIYIYEKTQHCLHSLLNQLSTHHPVVSIHTKLSSIPVSMATTPVWKWHTEPNAFEGWGKSCSAGRGDILDQNSRSDGGYFTGKEFSWTRAQWYHPSLLYTWRWKVRKGRELVSELVS